MPPEAVYRNNCTRSKTRVQSLSKRVNKRVLTGPTVGSEVCTSIRPLPRRAGARVLMRAQHIAIPYTCSCAQAPAASVVLYAAVTCADTPFVFAWSRSRPIKPRRAPRHLII
jgi:hypothetical protein